MPTKRKKAHRSRKGDIAKLAGGLALAAMSTYGAKRLLSRSRAKHRSNTAKRTRS